VVGGEITRLRTYVGPVPPADARVVDLGTVTAREAVAWLLDLAQNAPARVASSAMTPLIAAEGSEPWPQLLAIARNETRPREARREAMSWLAEATNQRLGIDGADDNISEDDDVRQQAVFAISQLPRDVAVPKLLDVARSSNRPPVRRQAIFWLGQSGDPRATALFAELLGLR
jgi:HEAT repeats